MLSLPKIKRCPCCSSINVFKINGVTYENMFVSLSKWVFKKKFNCRKCNEELGLFINSKEEKIVWLNYYKCKDCQFVKLEKLQKEKNKKHKSEKKYAEILKTIQNIQNEIRLNQIKIKINFKIKNRSMLIGHDY
jgi:hypothetical protein